MTQNLPAIASMSDLEKMATSIVKSGLFGVKSIDQAVTLMLVAQAEGLHPATAARDYHVIQGRPALKADAMLARFQQAGGKVEWEEYTDTRVSGMFSHPQSPKPVKIEWTIEMAKRIGLANKDNWRNYPRAMLRARVISEGVRTTYPAIASGIYTPEEIQDFAPEKDITPDARPTSGYLAALPSDKQNVMHETAAEIKALWANDQASDAYALIENSGFDAEETIALWSLLPSDIRSAHKRMKEAERAAEKGTISPAKHKRIEALIKENNMNRGALKEWCKDRFGVDSFPKLNDEQYKLLDEHIALMMGATTNAAVQESGSTAGQREGMISGNDQLEPTGNNGHRPGGQVATPAQSATITPDQATALEVKCNENDIPVDRLKVAAKVTRLAQIKAADYGRAVAWLDKAIAAKKEAV